MTRAPAAVSSGTPALRGVGVRLALRAARRSLSARRELFRCRLAAVRHRCCPRHAAIPLVLVDPQQIRYLRQSHEWPVWVGRWPCLVADGDWDLPIRKYEPFRVKQIYEICITGVKYTRTEAYRDLMQELAAGRTRFPPCSTEEEVHEYFRGILRTFESIRDRGYLSHRQLTGNPASRDEITVRVDRHGGLIKCMHGTHRLAMARILGLERIPVLVDLVHADWIRSVTGTTRPAAGAIVDALVSSSEGRA